MMPEALETQFACDERMPDAAREMKVQMVMSLWHAIAMQAKATVVWPSVRVREQKVRGIHAYTITGLCYRPGDVQ